MKTKTNRIFKIVSLLMVLSIFLSCEKNVKIESSFNQILNYDELKIQLENDADLQIIVSKINERQLALKNIITNISPENNQKLKAFREKYSSFESFKKDASDVDKEFFIKVVAYDKNYEQISLAYSNLSKKIRTKGAFNEYDLALLISERQKALHSNYRTQEDNCITKCFDKGTDVYHATYFTSRWELGMSENDSYFFAELAYQWYMLGCQDGCGNQK